MTALASAFVEGRIDTSRFGSDIRRGMASSTVGTASTDAGKSTGSRFSSAFGSALKIGATLGAAFAVVKGVQFLKGTIDEAREASKVSALTAAAIKSTGAAANVTAGHVAALSQRISEKVGVDDEAIQSGANLLLTFKNISNQVGDGNKIFDRANRTITDMSAALGQETKASAIQLGKALNDPIAGITALSRVGVTFTEQQKAQIAAMVESGHTMAAQKTILRELGSEFGGAGVAMADPIDRAKVAFSNLQEEIGTYLLPKLADLATWFVERGIPALGIFGDSIQDNVIPAVGRLADMVQAVTGFIQRNMDVIKPIAVTFAGMAVGIGAIVLATKAWIAVQAVMNAVLTANPISVVVVAIAALAAGLIIAYKRSDTFRAIVDKTWDVVKGAIKGAWSVISPVLQAFWGFLKNDLAPVIQWLWDKVVKPTFRLIGEGIKAWWTGFVKPVFAALKSYFQDVLFPIFKFLWNDVVKPVFNGIKSTISTAWSGIKVVLSGVGTFLKEKVVAAFGAAKDAIGTIWDKVKAIALAPIRFLINVVYNKGLVPLVNTVTDAVGLGEMLEPYNPGWLQNAASGGKIRGGYTGPGGKYQPAGIVHAGEYVIRKESREQIEQSLPGLLDRMNERGDVGMHYGTPPHKSAWERMRGYWLGGGVMPMPSATSVSKHDTPYYGAWYAADFNGVGDDTGKPIVAWKAGNVARAAMNGDDGSYGNVTEINHDDGNHTLYAHQSAILVAAREMVRAGQLIGRVGAVGNASGPHLHFEIEGGQVSSGGSFLGGLVGNVINATPAWVREALAQVGKIKRGVGHAGEMAGTFGEAMASPFGKIADSLKDWIMDQVSSIGSALAAPGGAVGPAQDYAIDQLKYYRWTAAQWEPLRDLWERESNWSVTADNPTSAAYGIPQANPGSKMATEGADWRTSYQTQIDWGLKYIQSVYGTPAAAWAHSENTGWYDAGGWLRPGASMVRNDTGKPEAVLTAEQWAHIKKLIASVFVGNAPTAITSAFLADHMAQAAPSPAQLKDRYGDAMADYRKQLEQAKAARGRLSDAEQRSNRLNRAIAKAEKNENTDRVKELRQQQREVEKLVRLRGRDVIEQEGQADRAKAAAERAAQAYADAQQTAIDRARNISQTVAATGSLASTPFRSAAGVLGNLRNAVRISKDWAGAIKALIRRGFRGPLLEEFIDEGPSFAAVALARSLLSSGDIDEIVALQAQLARIGDRVGASVVPRPRPRDRSRVAAAVGAARVTAAGGVAGVTEPVAIHFHGYYPTPDAMAQEVVAAIERKSRW